MTLTAVDGDIVSFKSGVKPGIGRFNYVTGQFLPAPRQIPSLPAPDPSVPPLNSPPLSPALLAKITRRLNIQTDGSVLPSPDGSLIANVEAGTVTIYDLEGHTVASYASPAESAINALWLGDSSGLLVWKGVCYMNPPPQPILILDRWGELHPTTLEGCNPLASADGTWIAGQNYDSTSGQTGIAVMPRAGGNARELVRGHGVELLAWQGDQVVYIVAGGVYSIPAIGGAAKKLLSTQFDLDQDTSDAGAHRMVKPGF